LGLNGYEGARSRFVLRELHVEGYVRQYSETTMNDRDVARWIREAIIHQVRAGDSVTRYREPIIGFVAAEDPGFSRLSEWTGIEHLAPEDLLPGARTVVCFFLPFAPGIAVANTKDKERVAREWAIAYVETNALIGEITTRLAALLSRYGIRAAAEPATGNFDSITLRSRWSHKSIAVLAGIGSIGLHHLVITDAGCAGRFGSLVIDVDLPIEKPRQRERCDYYATGGCLDCVLACPVAALDAVAPFDRRACWAQCLRNANDFLDLRDDVQVCGKCAVAGPCALESAA
jgi:epoxyqueuosine reductase